MQKVNGMMGCWDEEREGMGRARPLLVAAPPLFKL